MDKKSFYDGVDPLVRKVCKAVDALIAVMVWIVITIILVGCASCPCTRQPLGKNPNLYKYICWYNNYPGGHWYLKWRYDIDCTNWETKWNTPKGVRDSE